MALQQAGLEVGKVHRDRIAHAILQLPSEVCMTNGPRISTTFKDGLKEAGAGFQHVNPIEQNIAGWPYHGWQEQFDVSMNKGASIDTGNPDAWKLVARLPVTPWSTCATAALVASNTRSLTKAAESTFTTTEVIAGAVGGAPIIPQPVPSGKSVSDRGYGLRHRVGAWIAQMARELLASR